MATDVAAPLPAITLSPGMTITVEAGDASAEVTSLAVKVFQVVPGTRPAARPILLRGS